MHYRSFPIVHSLTLIMQCLSGSMQNPLASCMHYSCLANCRHRARASDGSKQARLHGLQAVTDQDDLLPDIPAQNLSSACGASPAAAVRCTCAAHAHMPRHSCHAQGASRDSTPHLWQQSQRVSSTCHFAHNSNLWECVHQQQLYAVRCPATCPGVLQDT